MDKGEFIKGGYTVRPGDGGSWIVRQGIDYDRSTIAAVRGFTNHGDLIQWLQGEHAAQRQGVTVVEAGIEVLG